MKTAGFGQFGMMRRVEYVREAGAAGIERI